MAVPASTLESLSPRAPRRMPPPAPARASGAQKALTALDRRRTVPRHRARGARGRTGRLGRRVARRRSVRVHRPRCHRGLPPAVHASRIRRVPAVEDHAHGHGLVRARRVAHELGRQSPRAPSLLRPRRRSALALHPRSTLGVPGPGHAHVGWLFRPAPVTARRDVADLLVDRDLVVVSRLFPVFAFATFALPFVVGWVAVGTLAGAVTALVWGGLLRIVLVHHVTWSTNSVCHMFGKRPFRSDDRSSNVAGLALLSLGESWHNAHHAFPAPRPPRCRPRSARPDHARDPGLGADGLGPRRALAPPRAAGPANAC